MKTLNMHAAAIFVAVLAAGSAAVSGSAMATHSGRHPPSHVAQSHGSNMDDCKRMEWDIPTQTQGKAAFTTPCRRYGGGR